MAFTNVIPLDKAQAKIEAVRGTAEATMTRWLYAIHDGMTWTYTQEHDTTKEQTRLFHATSGQELGIRNSRINFEGNATFEEAVWWLNLALDGANRTGVSTGSTPAGYTYAISPDGAADALDSATIKAGDGSTAYRFSRCMVNRLTMRFNPAQGGDVLWRITAEIFAIFVGTTTFDAPAETTRTKAKAEGTAVFIDAIGGTIGTTAFNRRIRSGSIVIDNQLQENVFSENVADVDPDVSRGEQLMTAELVIDHTSDDKFADMRANTPFKLRIQKVGAQIGITPTTNYRLRLDFGRAKFMAPTFGRAGVNRIATFGVMGEIDSTVLVPMSAELVNALATIAA
ncbi:MAG: phage tail tube protein [Dehalococcoidia bacterium]